MKKEAGKKIIKQRIEEFEKNSAVLKKKGHGETNIRSNYIDVFFEALGWNMKSHYDVVREFSQVDTSGTKRVDYAFKINGKLKFFVEAKEASIDLVNDKDAIYQAKRYAYSTNGKAPIVILTDFEEFRVFNVIKAPDYNNTDRELMKKYSFEYSGYLENWDLLWETFSKEAVGNGSLDALRGKIDKNTKTMDADFLEQITGWRETLAKMIALRNKELTVDELNEAVQRILDRLLFIRNLEDREIEPENTLLDKTKKSENIYKSIIPLFNTLDNVYNGLLFKKHFSEELAIDDKTIKDIIKSMCYPVSPFQFDVIEPEILGRIYEKFLGSKIRLTENHQAKIEEKMEVRKAGGVYYTPEYIVNYIVENTVGKKLNPSPDSPMSTESPLTPKGGNGLTPDEIKSIKICDPACGSGSFLLGAYSYLLDYHEKWYAKASAEDKKKYKADFYKTKDGEIKVTLEKRGDILRNNIFGVDIDKEATEVAIMSLYLKMLDEGFDKGERDLFFIKGHVLPDMTGNVKCGNSLIGTDYFDGKLEIDIQEMKEIKPFDWKKEFDLTPGPSPQGEGSRDWGFDIVIGNPPYLYSAGKDNIDYFKKNYKYCQYQTDYYIYFIEKGLQLTKEDGLFSYIIPDSWLNSEYFSKIRNSLLSKHRINFIALFKFYVFAGVSLENSIFNISAKSKPEKFPILYFNDPITSQITNNLNPEECLKENIINPNKDKNIDAILNKIELNSIQLSKYLKINRGLHAYRTDGYGISKYGKGYQSQKDKDDQSYHSKKKIDSTYLPELKGKNIFRYSYEASDLFLSYGNWLAEPRTPEFFFKPKIVLRKILGDRLSGTFIEEETAIDQSIYICIDENNEIIKLKSILAILVSGIGSWYLKNKYSIFDTLYPWYTKKQLDSFPIKYDLSLASIVDQLITANISYKISKSESDKKLYEQKISMLDKKIDDLVYKLYGLTDEEIKIVEGC